MCGEIAELLADIFSNYFQDNSEHAPALSLSDMKEARN